MEKINFINGQAPALNSTTLNQLQNNIDTSKTEIEKLISITSTAPGTCATGDKYFNTTSKKIFIAIATNTWAIEGENPKLNILYVNLSNKILYLYNGTTLIVSSGEYYSNGEQEIGTWIDGKAIYRRVITGITSPSGAADSETQLTNDNVIDTLVRYYGYIVNNNIRFSLGEFSPVNLSTQGSRLLVFNHNARLDCSTDFGNKTFGVVLEYTKI